MLWDPGRELTVPVRPGRFPGRGREHKRSPEVKVKQQSPQEMGVQTGNGSLAEGCSGVLSYLVGRPHLPSSPGHSHDNDTGSHTWLLPSTHLEDSLPQLPDSGGNLSSHGTLAVSLGPSTLYGVYVKDRDDEFCV